MMSLLELADRLDDGEDNHPILDALVVAFDEGWTFVRSRGKRSAVFARKDGSEFTVRLYQGRFTHRKYTSSIDQAITLRGGEELLEDAIDQVRREGWMEGYLAPAIARRLCALCIRREAGE
jgi:hypothetical protein